MSNVHSVSFESFHHGFIWSALLQSCGSGSHYLQGGSLDVNVQNSSEVFISLFCQHCWSCSPKDGRHEENETPAEQQRPRFWRRGNNTNVFFFVRDLFYVESCWCLCDYRYLDWREVVKWTFLLFIRDSWVCSKTGWGGLWGQMLRVKKLIRRAKVRFMSYLWTQTCTQLFWFVGHVHSAV